MLIRISRYSIQIGQYPRQPHLNPSCQGHSKFISILRGLCVDSRVQMQFSSRFKQPQLQLLTLFSSTPSVLVHLVELLV